MLSLGAFLAACTDKTKTPVDKPQVAAVVNGTEIMQREVDLIYKRIEVPGTPAPIATAQRRAILADLVRTELLAQQAVAEKLDKASDLEVDAQLARRQSLARLTEHRILEGVSPLPPDVLKKLVEANPIAFAQRKALVLDEMALEKADKPLLEKLDAAATKGATMDQLEKMAQEAKVPLRRTIRNTATDQLSPELVKPLLEAKPGVPVIIQNAQQRGTVLAVRSSTDAPLVGEVALQYAANGVNTQRRKQAVLQQVQRATDAAKITYLGEFAATDEDTKQEKDAKVPSVELPMGLKAAPGPSFRRLLAIAAAIALACAVSVLVLVFSLRYWRGLLWLPRPWPERWLPIYDKKVVEAFMIDPETLNPANEIGKSLITIALLATGGGLVLQLSLSMPHLPLWGIAFCVIAGLFLGVVMSHLLSKTRLRQASQNKRWWPAVIFIVVMLGIESTGILMTVM